MQKHSNKNKYTAVASKKKKKKSRTVAVDIKNQLVNHSLSCVGQGLIHVGKG